MFLTQDELKGLTSRIRRDAQIKELRHMGIEHRVRSDGTVAVLKAHVEKEFAGIISGESSNKRIEPNWAAV